MKPRMAAVTVGWLLAVAGCGPAGLEFTDHQQGYNHGVREVREVRKSGGVLMEMGMQTANSLGVRPSNEKKSADWNAGYQQGVKDELAK